MNEIRDGDSCMLEWTLSLVIQACRKQAWSKFALVFQLTQPEDRLLKCMTHFYADQGCQTELSLSLGEKTDRGLSKQQRRRAKARRRTSVNRQTQTPANWMNQRAKDTFQFPVNGWRSTDRLRSSDNRWRFENNRQRCSRNRWRHSTVRG